jgi:glucose/arabinose dehydrogenase
MNGSIESPVLLRHGGGTRLGVATLGICFTFMVYCGSLSAQTSCGTHVKIEDPIPGLIAPSTTHVKLTTIRAGLVSPVAGAVAPGISNRIFVLDQIGKIWSIYVSGPSSGQSQVFLDLSARLVPLGLFSPQNYDERGLLGLAFHPDYQSNGLFYTFTSEPASGHAPDFSTLTGPRSPLHPNEVEEQSVITEWHVNASGTVDQASARQLLRIAKPQFNHNGGTLTFGPDKLLYISLGDGGNEDDEGPGHVPHGNAQSLAANNVLGKILRIDPLGRNSANRGYGIPAKNPFVGRAGPDEIYARGFRNPYRMSFDATTGKLWVADVGQNDIEEIDVVARGGNYGWPVKEGTFLFDDGACLPDSGSFVYQDSPGVPARYADPVAEYDHVDGVGQPETRVAIVGGFVYRGTKLAALKGRYVFGDYSANIGTSVAGHMFVLDANNQVRELIAANRNPLALAVLGWFRDQHGEIYLLANGTGTLTGTTGMVLRLDGI